MQVWAIHRVHAPIITAYAVRGATNGFVRRPVAKWVLTILAAVRGIPAVPEKPVKENIRHAAVAVHMHGMERLVLVRQHINILVPVQTKPAEAAQLAVENTRSVLAPADMLGTEVLVPSKTLV